MKNTILIFLLFSSLESFCQTETTKGKSCQSWEFKYTDTVNLFSLCIPKIYKMKHSAEGVSFVDEKDAGHEISIQQQTNKKFTNISDWSTSVQKSQSSGKTSPTFTTTSFLVSNGSRILAEIGQRITGTNPDGSEINTILVPVNNNNSKIITIVFKTNPQSKVYTDLAFSMDAEQILNGFTFIPKNDYDQSNLFFKQLKLLIGKGDANYISALKSKLVTTEVNGAKTYSCSMELKGFQLSILETTSQITLDAIGMSTPYLDTQIALLLNNTERIKNEMVGFTATDYKAANPVSSAVFESVTELSKKGSDIKIRVFKFLGNTGYALTLL